MQLYEVILIGIALSIDACAITIANCATYKKTLTPAKEAYMPVAFALFQGVMPLIGYFIGSLFSDALSSIAKFLTAAIFFILSVKIVVDIIKENREVELKSKKEEKTQNFTLGLVLIQAIATSIDALAVGVTFINLTFSIWLAVGVIALVTLLFVCLALIFGKTLGKLFGKYAEWVGAGILFTLAIKSLIEALV